MSFFLRSPKTNKPSSILLKYYISKKEGRFTYSTGLNILPSEWNIETQAPISKRGRSDLNTIKRNLQKFSDLLEKTLDNFDLNKIAITKQNLKKVFDKEFKKNNIEDKIFLYLSDFALDLVKRLPNLHNRKLKRNIALALFAITTNAPTFL